MDSLAFINAGVDDRRFIKKALHIPIVMLSHGLEGGGGRVGIKPPSVVQ